MNETREPVTTSEWRSTSKATSTEPRSARRRLGSTSRNSGHERLEALEGAEALECGLDPGARHGETSARGCCFLERFQSCLRIATKGVRAGRIVAGKRIVGTGPKPSLERLDRQIQVGDA